MNKYAKATWIGVKFVIILIVGVGLITEARSYLPYWTGLIATFILVMAMVYLFIKLIEKAPNQF